jgi:4-hydroxybenzoate polyprenyltransferase
VCAVAQEEFIVATIATAVRSASPLVPLVRAVRPKQFIKNAIVFVPFVFTIRLVWSPLDPQSWLPLLTRSSIGFMAFCAVAGAEYLINDLRDVERDRMHPRKRFRPIAAGEVTPHIAKLTAYLLFAVGILLGASLQSWPFMLTLNGYAVLMLAYSYFLKNKVIIDVLTIAIGFALRVMAGAYAIEVKISPWLYLCAILGALFLATNKRRHELTLLRSGAAEHRKILSEYSTQLLDQMSSMVTACLVIAYSLYTFSANNLPTNHAMMLTIPFVMYGVFRYLYLVYEKDEGGRPDELVVHDKPLIACMTLYVVTSMVLLAVFRR